MVEAVRVYSIGLGGDSEVRFSGGHGISIGPRRVVPLSLLASEHPEVLPALEAQANSEPNSSQLRFALRSQHDEALLSRLPDDERRAWERLAGGPVDVARAATEDRRLARALARLERKGLVIYSGLTPTDAAHVLGISSHWSTTAAVLGAKIWARQMRRLYGFGTWPEGDAEGPSRQIFDLVIDAISQKLVEAGLHEQGQLAAAQADKLSRLLTEMAMAQRRDPTSPQVFSLQFAADTPVVAVGAPAASYYPEVARGLRVGLYMPRFAEVANAVGAVLGEVSQRVHLTITQPVRGSFRVFAANGPKDFPQLEAAVGHARELAAAEATALARQAGASSVEVVFAHDENSVRNDIDGDVFFEMRLTAIASGPPCMRADETT